MAISLGPTQINATQEDRIWRVECYSENKTDYRIVFHREVVLLDQDGNTVATLSRGKEVVRLLSQVLGDPDALQMLNLIKAKGDQWAQEYDAMAQSSGGVS